MDDCGNGSARMSSPRVYWEVWTKGTRQAPSGPEHISRILYLEVDRILEAHGLPSQVERCQLRPTEPTEAPLLRDVGH
jgi:hypothetical protein